MQFTPFVDTATRGYRFAGEAVVDGLLSGVSVCRRGWRPKGFPVGTRSVHFWPRCARCGILGRGRRSLATLAGFPRRKSLPGVIGTGDTTSSSCRRLYVAVCIIGMLAKNRPVQLALAVITLAVQVIYILIEMNALGSW
jgi:hypothetical protein